jgi:hypothetical protein
MTETAQRRATYADLEAVPPHLVAEIIDGEALDKPLGFDENPQATYAGDR